MCDASYCPDTGAAGYGYWIVSNRGSKPGGNKFKRTLKNSSQAEIYAIINSLAIGLKDKLIYPGDEVLIQTDCISAIDTIERSFEVINNSKGRFIGTNHFRKFIKKYNINYEFRHVKAHTSKKDKRSTANRYCDERAKKCMQNMRTEILNKDRITQLKERLNIE